MSAQLPIDRSDPGAVAALNEYLASRDGRKLGLPETGWFLLARDAQEVVFGLPGEDAPLVWTIGIDQTSSDDEGWQLGFSYPCWPRKVVRGELPAELFEPKRGFGSATDRSVNVVAVLTECDVSKNVEFSVAETAEEVIVGAFYRTDVRRGGQDCAPGARKDVPRSLRLSGELGTRTVLQAGVVPLLGPLRALALSPCSQISHSVAVRVCGETNLGLDHRVATLRASSLRVTVSRRSQSHELERISSSCSTPERSSRTDRTRTA